MCALQRYTDGVCTRTDRTDNELPEAAGERSEVSVKRADDYLKGQGKGGMLAFGREPNPDADNGTFLDVTLKIGVGT